MSETINDIPDGKVDEIVSQYEAIGYSVTKTRQADGTWTVNAEKPSSSDSA